MDGFPIVISVDANGVGFEDVSTQYHENLLQALLVPQRPEKAGVCMSICLLHFPVSGA